MTRRGWIGSWSLLLTLATTGMGLVAWKQASLASEEAAAAAHPEPRESVTVATVTSRVHRRTTTAIGTVHALRSITLRAELPGTVARAALEAGRVVEAGELLVALDVAVEEAQLAAQEARLALAEALLERTARTTRSGAASAQELDRARAERDVARAEVARIRAVIARKTIRAPFRARVGLSDVHVGQYLEAGATLTTLQGVEDAVHVDFAVPQRVARGLSEGDRVEVEAPGLPGALLAEVVALDARVDPSTRNAWVRARAQGLPLRPGASVRVRAPVGSPLEAVAVPVSALRRGPEGDHAFVIAPGADGQPRAHARRVESGAVLGDEVLILEGLAAGEQVAAAGSFKLRDGALVAATPEPTTGAEETK